MNTWKRILHYIAGYRLMLFVSLLLSLLTVGCALYIPKLSGEVVDYMTGPGAVDHGAVASTCLRIGIAAAILAIAQWLVNVLNNRMTWGVVRALRRDAFARIECLPLSYLDAHPSFFTLSSPGTECHTPETSGRDSLPKQLNARTSTT